MKELGRPPEPGDRVRFIDRQGRIHHALVVWNHQFQEPNMLNIVYVIPMSEEPSLAQDGYGMDRVLECSVPHSSNVKGNKMQYCWTW